MTTEQRQALAKRIYGEVPDRLFEVVGELGRRYTTELITSPRFARFFSVLTSALNRKHLFHGADVIDDKAEGASYKLWYTFNESDFRRDFILAADVFLAANGSECDHSVLTPCQEEEDIMISPKAQTTPSPTSQAVCASCGEPLRFRVPGSQRVHEVIVPWTPDGRQAIDDGYREWRAHTEKVYQQSTHKTRKEQPSVL